MKMKCLPFAVMCLLVATVTNTMADENLWDQVIRQEQVFTNVHYKGRSLAIWKQDQDNGLTRYYVTPICVLDLSSARCSKEAFVKTKPRSIFNFQVKLWDHEIATVVQKSLRQNHIDVELGNILILPMQNVRFGLSSKNSNLGISYEWRSFLSQPNTMAFEMYPSSNHACHILRTMLQNKTDNFLAQFKPYFEFSLVSSSTTSRHIKISSDFLDKSSFYSNLKNHNDNNDGTVFLTSNDVNKLAHDVFTSVAYNEEVSDKYQEAKEEGTIVNELLKIFKHDKEKSDKLSEDKWDSVFWDNIYTRPDIQTSFLKETTTYDKNKKLFKMDDKKAEAYMKKLATKHSDGHDDSANVGLMVDGFGLNLGKSHGETQSNGEANEDADKHMSTFSFAKLNEGIKKKNANVRWNGKKFVQKSFDLYRINTKNLQSKTETAFNRVITSKEKSTQKIEIQKDTEEDPQWANVYDNTVPLPTTTTTTTTTTTPSPTTKTTKKKEKTTKKPTTKKPEKRCPDPIDEDLYHSLILKGTEPCSYIHNILHPTPAPTRPPPPPPPPPPPQHSTNIADVANTAINVIGKAVCFWCGG